MHPTCPSMFVIPAAAKRRAGNQGRQVLCAWLLGPSAFAPRFGPLDQIAPSAPSLTLLRRNDGERVVSTPSSFETIARWMSAMRTVCLRSLRMRAIGLLGFAAGGVSFDWMSVFALGRSVGMASVPITGLRRQII